MTCGHVGCCDDSPNRHATKHFHGSRHPVVKSFEPGEDWAWCYEDDLMVDRIPTFAEESPEVHYRSPASSS
jgi:thioredoxin reductase (NADPH)